MARNGKRPNIGCLFYSVIFAAGLIIAIIAVIAGAINSAKSAEYQKVMEGVKERSGSQITGSMMVAFDLEKHLYCETYIPESILAETAEDVRYILFFKSGADLEGTYSNGAGSGYRRKVTVRIRDLKTGEDIAEDVFYGSAPPSSISTKPGDKPKKVYGSYPDHEKVQSWILSILG